MILFSIIRTLIIDLCLQSIYTQMQQRLFYKLPKLYIGLKIYKIIWHCPNPDKLYIYENCVISNMYMKYANHQYIEFSYEVKYVDGFDTNQSGSILWVIDNFTELVM